MNKGTIILTPFPFTDLSGHKVRPALILHNHKSGEDCIAVFISSVIQKTKSPFDIKVLPSDHNGLKVKSVIKVGKIATLQRKVVLGEVGMLESSILKEVDVKLKLLFKI
jgi:mRNA interferase MazF